MKQYCRFVLPLILLVCTVACSSPDKPTNQLAQSKVLTQERPEPTPAATPTLIPAATPTLTPATTPTLTPTPTPAAWDLDRSIPPDRDLYSLTYRLKKRSGESIPKIINKNPVNYKEGREDTFHVLNTENKTHYEVTASLEIVTQHAYWYIDKKVQVDKKSLERSSQIFESIIYPKVTEAFGTEQIPGIDNDIHLTILHTPLSIAAGYFSSMDEHPQEIYELSNEREMIYIDTRHFRLGSTEYLATLAHELTHAIQYQADSTEDTWILEGLAETGMTIAGYPSSSEKSFMASKSTSLINWSENPLEALRHYGGTKLFFEYLAGQFGGYKSLRTISDLPERGIPGIEKYLKTVGAEQNFSKLFGNWIVANYLDAPDGGPYSYQHLQVRVPFEASIRGSETLIRKVPQYGATYIELRPESSNVNVSFKGQTLVKMFPDSLSDKGYCWWSNRGDSINTTLTGKFQLPPNENVSMKYTIWYSLEENWDYLYVEASTDNGNTWDVLEGKHTSSQNPLKHSFGHGYTGKSAHWLEDEVDLSPYANQEILLRFEYVTDDSFSGPGVCIDDIAIPALSFLDKAEEEKAIWDSFGFIRTKNATPQKYILRIIEVGSEIRVREIALNSLQEANFSVEGFGTSLIYAVIVVGGIAENTTLPSVFEIQTTTKNNR